MITIPNLTIVSAMAFKTGDLVRVLGSVSEGDSPVMFAKARSKGFVTDNLLVPTGESEVLLELLPNGSVTGFDRIVMQSPSGILFNVLVDDSGVLITSRI